MFLMEIFLFLFQEQVVPSCSPFINFDDEKPSNSQQASQESTTNDYLDISITNNNIEQKENSVPTDEKPPIMNHCRPLQDLEGPKPAKRQVRMMTKSTEIKPIDFLKSDNIFG
uniref:Cnidarian restricted protein n=1 Tax=Clytia hemisphaerica TaxID=252671 RepID=A0A7M5UQX7_9CNID